MTDIVDEGTNKTALTESNCAFYNTSSFAFRVKKEDVFTDQTIEAYRKFPAALSALDSRVMWLPTGPLQPSFYHPNKIFFKTFLGKHRDSEMPIVMCVSKQSLGPELARIYEDEDVVQTQKDLLESLEAHTMEAFSNAVPEQANINGYLESTLEDDEVLLIYDTFLNVIHRLSNGDLTITFSKETPCKEVTVGSMIKPLSIFTEDKKNNERYSINADRSKPDHRVLATGPVVMRELKHLIRLMLKQGKGDTGSSKDEQTDAEDTEFESALLHMITKNAPRAGPGGLSIVASYFEFKGVVDTITKYGRKYTLDACPSAVWDMFAVCNLASFSAPTIAYVTTSEKGPKFHMKTANPLTNLQFTVARECRTFTQLVLYLAKRTCLIRCPENVLTIVSNRSKQCESCNSGENCAMAWVCTMTECADLANSLTDAKKRSMDGPFSHHFTQLFISEYNDQASVFGSAGNKEQKAGRGYLEAYGKAMAHLEPVLKVDKTGTSSQALTSLISALGMAKQYLDGAEHNVDLMHRSQCMGNKLETVLTDNEGGVQKVGLGLLCVPMFRSKVLTYMMRFACHVNFKLLEFSQKPTQGLSDAHSAVASKNVGVYSVKKDQEQIPMKAYYLHPSVNQETEEVYDVNTAPKITPVTVDQVNIRTTNKYKMFNGALKSATESEVSAGGGMSFGAAPMILDANQRKSIIAAVNWTLLKQCPRFESTNVPIGLNKLVDSILAEPMSVFNTDELAVVTNWKSLLSMFIMGSMMNSNHFQIKTSFNYCGITVPKFALLESAKSVNLEPVCPKFLTAGPTLVYAKTKVDSYKANVSGQDTMFVNCVIAKFNPLRQFVGNNMLNLNNTTMAGVFLPFKSDYKSGVEVDEMCDDMMSLAGMSRAERCKSVFKNAQAIVSKIREVGHLGEDDDISFDQVYSLFEQYSANVLLDDDDLRDMVAHITNSDYMAAVCGRVSDAEGNAEVEEEEKIDFDSLMMRGSAQSTFVESANTAAGSAIMGEFADD